ncbi:hypothetical protein BASA83_004139 [Batrachochytrium salamandrivorans]|nr:hypothetical protein BASA83_004139 [Batrachochytrium salamandrivorans]
MNRKISKQQISSPTPLMSPMAYHNHQLGKRSTDSGIDVMHAAALAAANGPHGSRSASPAPGSGGSGGIGGGGGGGAVTTTAIATPITTTTTAAIAASPTGNGRMSGMAARAAERLSFGRHMRTATSSYGTPPAPGIPTTTGAGAAAANAAAVQSQQQRQSMLMKQQMQQRHLNFLQQQSAQQHMLSRPMSPQAMGRVSPVPAGAVQLPVHHLQSPPIRTAVTPFSAGRFDVSASIAGGPMDPRRLRLSDAPPTLNLRQYQSFAQAASAYRRQIQAMAAATDTFVRALEELSDCVPAAQLVNASVVADLDFFIDSTQLLVNTHQIWASTIEKEIEEPLFSNIETITAKVKNQQVNNKSRIQGLINDLHLEEDKSYKMKKKKQRDLSMLQESLNVRVSLADEIKRLSIENETLYDTLSHQDMECILNLISRGVVAELETYDTIMEGFHKIGSAAGSRAADSHEVNSLHPSRIQTITSSKITSSPMTDIPAPHSPLDDQLDADFMRKVFQGLS